MHSLPKVSFNEERDRMVRVLRDMTSLFAQDISDPFKFRMVSNAQANPYMKAYYQWQKTGQAFGMPITDEGSFRSTIYAMSAPGRKLEAYIKVSKVALTEHADAAVQGFSHEAISMPLVALRGMVERIASAASLRDELKTMTTERQIDIETVHYCGEKVTKALYGTRLDWLKIVPVDLRTMDPKQACYVKKELTSDVSAKNVLTVVDKLEKRVPGIRLAYEILCEFLHPNVGDLYASSLNVSSSSDYFGTRHVWREIGVGPKSIEKAFDVARVLSQVLEVIAEAINILPGVFLDLQAVSEKLVAATQLNAHKIRKNYPKLFRGADYCPCLSGKKVRDCN